MIKSNQSYVGFFIALVLALNLVSVNSVAITPFTALEMDTILTTIDSYFFPTTKVPVVKFNVEIRKFLRAVFHDCMGGCDGSINVFKTANRGLEQFVDIMNQAYTLAANPTSTTSSLFNRLTRADFWVLSEQRALAYGIQKSKFTPTVTGPTFWYGRPSEPTYNADSYEATFPDGIDSWTSMLSKIHVGLPKTTESDIVALLGLHGPGIATFSNSGFKGPWGPTADKNVVNNNYFNNLLSYGRPSDTFTQVAAAKSTFPAGPTNSGPSIPPATNKIQWEHQGSSPAKMMLPIDMQIYLSFSVDSTGLTNDGKYCPQKNNNIKNIVKCASTTNQKYLPPANNAQLA